MPDAARRLVVEDLVIRFGGATAVDHVDLDVPPGRVTGLIGPNGAGKTTTFNACSGLLRPDGGRIRFGDEDITDTTPPHRAQLGMGRTFQRMHLFDSVTVAENVALGREALLSGRNPLRHVFAGAAQNRAVAAATDEAIELCGIGNLARRPVAGLSTGQRRLVELARAVAGGFELLLLDEPSSGLDVRETERFGQILRQLVDERGIGILLVEHDMSLVMTVCSYLFVIDFGRPIFDGPPRDAQRSDVVRAAYLGEVTAA